MTLATIKLLNKLNLNFYESVAFDFDQTRQQPWEGWLKLPNKISLKNSQFIDIGCGNGRLGFYLLNQGLNSYVGLDSSQQLLNQAHQKLANSHTDIELISADLIEELHSNTLNTSLSRVKKSTLSQNRVFAIFGVLHHLPSYILRQKLFTSLAQLMEKEDYIVVSCWQFERIPNLWQRRVAPELINLKSTELEQNDYILDWQRGERAYRYCHLTTAEEMSAHIAAADLMIIDQWEADGKTKNVNQYYLLTKKA